MKQPKQNTPVKSARKTAKRELKERLLSTLKNMFEKEKIKLTKKVKKRSVKLVKTLAKELSAVKPATEKAIKEVKNAVTPKPVKTTTKNKVAKAAADQNAPAKTIKPAAAKATVEKK